jgi:hypothetical protein
VVDEQSYARVCVRAFFRQHKPHVAEAILSKYAPDEPPYQRPEPKPEPPTDPELVAYLLRLEKDELSDKEALLAEWVRDDDGSDQDAYWIRKLRRRCSYLRGKIGKIQKGERTKDPALDLGTRTFARGGTGLQPHGGEGRAQVSGRTYVC